jgi:hydroxymethylpyrimidine/phosphomethylpyrimidine kinase
MTIHCATQNAKQVLWGMIYDGYNPGKGVDVVNHMAYHHPPALQDNDIPLWIELQDTINNLLPQLPPHMIPEVGINFVYALPQATDKERVLGIQGRIIKIMDKAHQVGNLQLGASTHVAAIVLASMNQEPDMRSAMNIAFSTQILERAKKMGFLIGTFDREDEPPDQKTMDWGTKNVIATLGEIPDIIWDSGAKGKEPMIRIIAKSPKQVLEKVIALREK